MKTHLWITRWLSFWVVVGIVLAPMGHPAPVSAAPVAQEGVGELVKVTFAAGDSLLRFVRIYGVTGSSIRAINPQLKDPNTIAPGMVITLPVVKTFTPSLSTPFFYTAQAGDDLFSICAKFEMDVSAMIYANNIPDNKRIELGRTYVIPAGPHAHIVKKGELLRDIAAKYNVTIAFLLASNSSSLASPDLIFAGQKIFVPVIYNATPVALSGAGTAPPPPTVTISGTTTIAVPVLVEGEFIRATVRSRENLGILAVRYGVSGSSLLAVNPKLRQNPNVIFPGMVITIPVPISFQPSRTTPFFYIVAEGETKATIAAKFELDFDTLVKANPGNGFAPNSTVLIPPGPHYYTIKIGDDMKKIAELYGIPYNLLVSANSAVIVDPNAIFPGQKIFIPIQYNAKPVPF